MKRARAGLRQTRPAGDGAGEDVIVAKFVRAHQDGDLAALVALLTDDVFIAMPPMPYEYQGRDVVADFFDRVFRAGRRFDLVATRANRQPAFEVFRRTGGRPRTGLIVLTLDGDRIGAMTHFGG